MERIARPNQSVYPYVYAWWIPYNLYAQNVSKFKQFARA